MSGLTLPGLLGTTGANAPKLHARYAFDDHDGPRLLEVVEVRDDVVHTITVRRGETSPDAVEPRAWTLDDWAEAERCHGLRRLPGKPHVPAFGDAPRAGLGGDTTKAGAPAAPTAPALPDVDGLARRIAEAIGGALPAPVAAGRDDDAHARLDELADRLEDVAGSLSNRVEEVARQITDALARPTTRARITAHAAAASGTSPVLAALLPHYTPGVETAANVLLAAPPSIGKSWAVRQLGKAYDLALEHGCTDDVDEIATLVGGPVPTVDGGFVVVDGVLTQAVRAASEGQSVLLFLDETLRLGTRAQEWLLSFLTGTTNAAGEAVYRLRTRKASATGALEVIECPRRLLHVVGATNLGAMNPVEAFWSRWRVVRIPFDEETVRGVATSIAAAYGVAKADTVGEHMARAVALSRRYVADGSLRFPLDLRALERAAMSCDGTAADCLVRVADQVADACANWAMDTGDVAPESGAPVAEIVRALGGAR